MVHGHADRGEEHREEQRSRIGASWPESWYRKGVPARAMPARNAPSSGLSDSMLVSIAAPSTSAALITSMTSELETFGRRTAIRRGTTIGAADDQARPSPR